jgi:uncharacterized protein with GYD domain
MSFYMVQGRYTQSAIKSLISNPEDRSKPSAALVKAAGGKLLQYFWCLGDYDFMAIVELPSDEAAVAISMAAGSVGHVTDLKTTRLMTAAEAVKAMAAAEGVAKSLPAPKGKQARQG